MERIKTLQDAIGNKLSELNQSNANASQDADNSMIPTVGRP